MLRTRPRSSSWISAPTGCGASASRTSPGHVLGGAAPERPPWRELAGRRRDAPLETPRRRHRSRGREGVARAADQGRPLANQGVRHLAERARDRSRDREHVPPQLRGHARRRSSSRSPSRALDDHQGRRQRRRRCDCARGTTTARPGRPAGTRSRPSVSAILAMSSRSIEGSRRRSPSPGLRSSAPGVERPSMGGASIPSPRRSRRRRRRSRADDRGPWRCCRRATNSAAPHDRDTPLRYRCHRLARTARPVGRRAPRAPWVLVVSGVRMRARPRRCADDRCRLRLSLACDLSASLPALPARMTARSGRALPSLPASVQLPWRDAARDAENRDRSLFAARGRSRRSARRSDARHSARGKASPRTLRGRTAPRRGARPRCVGVLRGPRSCARP